MKSATTAPGSPPNRFVYVFGPFRLDPQHFELCRHSHRVRLSAGLTRLLILFASRPRELITREEIAACLWRDTRFVDAVSGINTAVNRLRVALGDDAANPTYIETLVGLGYRFVVEVERSNPIPASAQSDPESLLAPKLTPEEEGLTPTVSASGFEPLSEREGDEAPDVRSKDEPSQEQKLVLPSDTKIDSPRRAWGKARFLLVTTAIIVVLSVLPYLARRRTVRGQSAAPLITTDVKQVTFTASSDPVQTASLSHDGSMVAFMVARGVSVRVLDRGVNRGLLTPAGLAVSRMTWMQGDSTLLLSGRTADTGKPEVWILSLKVAPPRLLFEDAVDAAPSLSGASVAFTKADGSELWVSDLDGKRQKLLRKSPEGTAMFRPLWSADGKRISCELRETPVNSGDGPEARQYRWEFGSFSSDTGELLDERKDVRADSASLTMGGHLYFTTPSPKFESSSPNLYDVQTDPETGRFLSQPSATAPPGTDYANGVSVSDDGHTIAVLMSRRSLQVHAARIDARTKQLTDIRPLIHPAPDNYPHSWTPSQDAVIFESSDQEKYAVYKQRLDGTPAVMLARSVGGAVLPQVTPDGRWVLFDNLLNFHPNAIYRVPLGGGEIQELPTRGQVGDFQCSVSLIGRCAVRKVDGPFLSFYELDPLTGEGKILGKTSWVENAFGDWSLSADGTTVAMPSHENPVGIRLIPLGRNSFSQLRGIAVEGVGRVVEVIWAPDSKGFYVESQSSGEYLLSYVTLRGEPTLIRRSAAPIWGIPSRDGSRIAFAELERNVNVWIAHH